MSDRDWRSLIDNIKVDFSRVAKEKAGILRELEKWAIFPNKFVQIANVCADLYSDIVDGITLKGSFKVKSFRSERAFNSQIRELESVRRRALDIHAKSLQLSLLTPVMAEAFINMIVLMLCKRDIKDNVRQFSFFMRQNIDTKVFDLPHKCEGFSKGILQSSPQFVAFKRIMDKRNHAIHGNIDPEKEALELVYFDGNIPLFTEGGDNIGRFWDAMERQHRPSEATQDYVDMHLFFGELINCLEPKTASYARAIVEDPYPGYNVRSKIAGALLPHHVVGGYMPELRYDDDL